MVGAQAIVTANDIKELMTDQIHQLRAGTMTPVVAREVGASVRVILGLVRLEMEYAKDNAGGVLQLSPGVAPKASRR